jgi:very-short-patch-repair endonuclease
MPFQNKLLQKVFDGVLTGKDVHLKSDLMNSLEIDQSIARIPMSLSRNQINAIHMAWQNEISYIQGPPGTGKSHTIIALMLSAIILGKKVLLVSQKKAAIDIVRDKVNSFLSSEHALIYVGGDTSERRKLKGFLDEKLALTRGRQYSVDDLNIRLKYSERKIEELRDNLNRNYERLRDLTNLESQYYAQNESFVELRQSHEKKYRYPLRLITIAEQFHQRSINNLGRMRQLEVGDALTLRNRIFLARSYKVYLEKLGADRKGILEQRSTYLQDLLNLAYAFTESQNAYSLLDRRQSATNSLSLRRNIEEDQKLLNSELKKNLRLLAERNLNASLMGSRDNTVRGNVDSFSSMLHYVSPHKLIEVMNRIDYNKLTQALPLWAGEIKDLGSYLSFSSEVFDLVVVDEASQVNIAEVIPALYRGTRFCVVGDKAQLGLNAAGLFRLNKTFEQLSWNQYLSGAVPFSRAEQDQLLVSNSSILDFITAGSGFTVPHEMLDEHYRSMPQLAHFTSEEFYQNKLRVMTETPANVKTICFQPIKVEGERDPKKKVVPAEVDRLREMLVALVRRGSYRSDSLLSKHQFVDGKPSIGVVSFLTNQRDHIRERIEAEFSLEERGKFQLAVGTPEEFQGNERDIIFLTLGLDGTSRWGKGHYENPNRFNVATSRARKFTYMVYAGLPSNTDLLKRYARHFRVETKPSDFIEPSDDLPPVLSTFPRWRFGEKGLESEFEREVYNRLLQFVKVEPNGLEIYNQVPSCNKRIDFVLYNNINERSCAIEVDGKQHFGPDGSLDPDDIEREKILKRAGWTMLRIPYYDWYDGGWLCRDDNPDFMAKWQSFCGKLRETLNVA